ncbi:UDP-glucose 4-epimerase [Gloeomargarita lithophora Alchichica-D10]|uniref:UDP-glucose 4-epimerase n=1 Tax=Gloeomargarita lithophora Alchichica-D10 TaxID=1188229 RepID=A0A1J0AGY3_9CYAN|nr:NAD-dependent epimerase/dehydratase family protein [Gloeomargarita lithophora]APB35198.1 UDP-glucose 4-epimerase [Gloeomargarita lithophora Alchichica-D10]
MRVLITGGAGFIGSAVQDIYVQAGHEVAILDNFTAGNPAYVHPQSRVYQSDLRESQAVGQILQEWQPQVVSHHAAQIDVRQSVAQPVEDAQINILGALNVLEAAAKGGVKQFIFASSGGACYGELQQIPAPENHPLQPISPYGIAKVTMEHYLHFYYQVYGLCYGILRYANVYGPRQGITGEAGVITAFITALLTGQTPVIYGGGTQTRDYVYVGDVAQVNLQILGRLEPLTLNIGTGQETSVLTLYELMQKLISTKITPQFLPERLGEISRSALEVGQVRQILGWQAQTPLQKGLQATLDWYRQVLG